MVISNETFEHFRKQQKKKKKYIKLLRKEGYVVFEKKKNTYN